MSTTSVIIDIRDKCVVLMCKKIHAFKSSK